MAPYYRAMQETTAQSAVSEAPQFVNVVVESTTATTARVRWTLDKFATGQIEYGATTAYGSFTTEETSFDYSEHVQTITGLTSGTEYHFRLLAEDAEGNSAVSVDYDFTTTAATSAGAQTARDQFWIDDGWGIEWASTPGTADVGVNGLDFVNRSEWLHGSPLQIQNVTGSPSSAIFDVQNAPDGAPALRINLPAGSTGQSNGPGVLVRGRQLNGLTESKRVVFSQEIYYPAPSSTQQERRQYVGLGHYWGSDASDFAVSGSSRPDPSPGWTVRIPTSRNHIGGSGLFYAYTYFPDDPGPAGRSYHTFTLPQPDRWELIEVEVNQNVNPNAATGSFRVYINEELVTTVNNIRIREKADVLPKGFGIFVARGNPELQSTVYLRNQKIYIKDH